jgi:hypothetical protein
MSLLRLTLCEIYATANRVCRFPNRRSPVIRSVEHGKAPELLDARTLIPISAARQYTKYNGSASADEAANF